MWNYSKISVEISGLLNVPGKHELQSIYYAREFGLV